MSAGIAVLAFWVLCVLWVVASLETYVNYRRARLAPYFLIRRDARLKAWGWAGAALLILVGVVVLLPV